LQIKSTKRQKEQARQQHQKEKEARRAERKREKSERPRTAGDVDPDIAHIIPGPQPRPEDEEGQAPDREPTV
jgi:hypothetical protein